MIWLSYKVVKYELQNPSAVQSTELGYFFDSAHADEFAQTRNEMETNGNVWYEAHPSVYGQVSMQLPTPVSIPAAMTRLTADHNRLVKLRRSFRWRQRPSTLSALCGVALLFYAILGKSPYWIEFSAGGIALLVPVPVLLGSTKYRLRPEEWLFLRTYDALNNLNDYVADPNHSIRYLDDSRKKLQILANEIGESRPMETLEIERQALGPIRKFEKGLLALTQAVKDVRKTDQCQAILVELSNFLLKTNPQLQDVRRLNAMIFGLGEAVEEKKWYWKTWGWLNLHLRLRTSAPLVLTLLSGYVLFIILTSNGFTKDVAVGPSVDVSLTLTVTYIGFLGYRLYGKRKAS